MRKARKNAGTEASHRVQCSRCGADRKVTLAQWTARQTDCTNLLLCDWRRRRGKVGASFDTSQEAPGDVSKRKH